MRCRWAPTPTGFFLGLFILVLLHLALLRLGLVIRNADSAAGTPPRELLIAFAIGLRFDIVAACYLLAPFIVVGHLPWVGLADGSGRRRLFFVTFLGVMSLLTLILLAEYEFFRAFQTRFNQLAINYFD